MIIKKFQGESEKEAMEKVKAELGSQAIVMNIKTQKPKGLFKSLRKSVVEVTAALEENADKTTKEKEQPEKKHYTKEQRTQNATKIIQEMIDQSEKKEPIVENGKAPSAIEEKLNNLASILEQQMDQKKDNPTLEEGMNQENNLVELVHQQLINNEVEEEFANVIIEDLDEYPNKEEAIDAILASVYQKVVLKLGQPKGVELNEKKPRVCFFVGSTGVGKTTTIAKIASAFKIEKKSKVALLTSDTYRIAAVEQLKTYANILSIPIRVIYNAKELKTAVQDYKNYDLLLVDTAGRSHKNQNQCDELKNLLDSVPAELREVYLVLSATTKYRDLMKIVQTYSDMTDYKLVFTKLDETGCYGNILNVRMLTNAPLSYTTCGQVVPDDFGILDAQTIAKQLLGGCE